MKVTAERKRMVAFALGYFDGRTDGVERNPFRGEPERMYREGYDLGVADYCQEAHPEDHAADQLTSA